MGSLSLKVVPFSFIYFLLYNFVLNDEKVFASYLQSALNY
jgi:hypothetical protein